MHSAVLILPMALKDAGDQNSKLLNKKQQCKAQF